LRAETEIAAANVDLFPGRDRFVVSAAIAVCTVDPAIEAPLEAVNSVLLIAQRETGEEHFAMVRLAIPVRIPGEQNIRCGADQDSVFPGDNPGWAGEIFQE